MKIQEKVDYLLKAKKAYYDGNPIISDAKFDSLEDELRKLDFNNPYFSKVGIQNATTGKTKIKHSIKMRSMQKANTFSDVEKWLKNTFENKVFKFNVQPKIDGFSLTICYENGKLKYAATRGDGFEGQDVTDKMKHIPSIPQTISEKQKIEIRGELYLPKNSPFLNTTENKGKPARNIGVGLINRKDKFEDCKYLKFIGYEVVHTMFDQVSAKLDFIKSEGFIANEYKLLDRKDLQEYYNQYLSLHRNDWEFETDGLILQPNEVSISEEIEDNNDHHPKWAQAWKPISEAIETKLIDVEWNITRLGNIVPTAIFEPVFIQNRKLQRASLFNYEFVEKTNLRIGDRILIKLANDVIPHVEKSFENNKGSNLLITNCPSCNSKLDREGVQIICNNPICSTKSLEKIIYWVSKCEMDLVSGATVELLWDKQKISSIADLYKLKESDLEGVEGIGDSKRKNIIAQINKSRIKTSIQFIDGLGIHMVGIKALQNLGIVTVQDFLNFNDSTFVTGQKIIEWKNNSANIKMFNEVWQCLSINDTTNQKTWKATVCFTGSGPMGRKELIKLSEDKGYKFSDSVNKDLNILVCDDVNDSSSKLMKAKKLGIKLITYKDFLTLVA